MQTRRAAPCSCMLHLAVWTDAPQMQSGCRGGFAPHDLFASVAHIHSVSAPKLPVAGRRCLSSRSPLQLRLDQGADPTWKPPNVALSYIPCPSATLRTTTGFVGISYLWSEAPPAPGLNLSIPRAGHLHNNPTIQCVPLQSLRTCRPHAT